MQISKSMSTVIIVTLAACSVAVPAGPVPRKAPELSFYDRSGKAISLSNFKGRVVALEFLFVRSMHCARVAQTLNKLNNDLSLRGFQSIGVAFSAPQSEANAAAVGDFIQSLSLAYPVGYTDKENVDRFLDRGKYEVLNIPQVVIIDRAGVIRAQSGARPGDPKLEDENSLRALLDFLLREKVPLAYTK
ncbi:MAG TPA: TlpA disulfide reductase family protein [Candidatus Acidoferrum sp.]